MKVKKKINLYWHTIKHLRLRQLFFQIYYRFKTRNKPLINTLKRSHLCLEWAVNSHNHINLSDNLELCVLGDTGNIIDTKIWNSSAYSKLWLYNLHYFDVLKNDGRFAAYSKYIDLWIENNPPVLGNGWEPYPISLRAVNWIKYFTQINDIKQSWIDSLAMQAEVLAKNIEYHLLGNHILANAKALIFLGVFFSDKKAKSWLNKGLNILNQQIKEQFLNDGGHFELTPMYHAILLWDICELISLAKQTNIPKLNKHYSYWVNVLISGLYWLRAMTHPDGDIAFFNDATFKIAPKYKDLLLYLKRLDLNIDFDAMPVNSNVLTSLTTSGYFSVDMPNNCKAIIDIAEVGPTYQPGHAHADTLSFELSLFGKRFIVNSGVSEYGFGEQRTLQRSTASHSTVVINGENSSEVWHSFRVAKRANVGLQSLISSGEIIISGWHNGYKRLVGKNMHYRNWKFSKNSLLISDKVTGKKDHAEARFYFHPEVIIEKLIDETIFLSLNNNKLSMHFEGAKLISLKKTFWFPGFGESLSNYCLLVGIDYEELQTRILW